MSVFMIGKVKSRRSKNFLISSLTWLKKWKSIIMKIFCVLPILHCQNSTTTYITGTYINTSLKKHSRSQEEHSLSSESLHESSESLCSDLRRIFNSFILQRDRQTLIIPSSETLTIISVSFGLKAAPFVTSLCLRSAKWIP